MILAVSTNADPQPDPEPVPDPEAEAAPEPEPQYGGRLISNNPMAGQGVRYPALFQIHRDVYSLLTS